MLTTLICGPK
jgi:hypothetical protein